MEAGDSLPCSQEPARRSYPELDESNVHPQTLIFKIHFNIIFLFTPTSPNYLLLGFPTKTCVYS